MHPQEHFIVSQIVFSGCTRAGQLLANFFFLCQVRGTAMMSANINAFKISYFYSIHCKQIL